MQNSLGASDVEWGLWNAVFTTAFLPAFVIYGFLSLHVRFRTIILASAIVAIPQFLPLLFVTTLHQATLFAFAAGLSGGMATSAYLDLLIRSCPIGYHGTVMMASSAIYFLSTRSGDVLGSYLYGISGGFGICIVLMTATSSYFSSFRAGYSFDLEPMKRTLTSASSDQERRDTFMGIGPHGREL